MTSRLFYGGSVSDASQLENKNLPNYLTRKNHINNHNESFAIKIKEFHAI
jgi:hypothetical protein